MWLADSWKNGDKCGFGFAGSKAGLGRVWLVVSRLGVTGPCGCTRPWVLETSLCTMFMYSICQLPIAVTERARGPRCRADNREEENSQGENRLGAETPEMAWMSRGALLAAKLLG